MVRSKYVKHIKVWVGNFYHHALVLQNGQVVHYTGTSAGRTALEDGKIKRESYEDFTEKYSGDVKLVKRVQGEQATEAERRARTCVGIKNGYELASFNCESFVEWCQTGVPISEQMDRFVQRLTAGLIAGGVPVPLYQVGLLLSSIRARQAGLS